MNGTHHGRSKNTIFGTALVSYGLCKHIRMAAVSMPAFPAASD